MGVMNTSPAQPIPKDLREQMIRRMQSAPDEDLVFAYEVMLFAEKNRGLERNSERGGGGHA